MSTGSPYKPCPPKKGAMKAVRVLLGENMNEKELDAWFAANKNVLETTYLAGISP
jgi:hypothetical protein